VHWTLGILRHFQTFFWLRVFSAPKENPRPPHHHYRKPLGALSNEHGSTIKAAGLQMTTIAASISNYHLGRC
jgi:hypothetical protein